MLEQQNECNEGVKVLYTVNPTTQAYEPAPSGTVFTKQPCVVIEGHRAVDDTSQLQSDERLAADIASRDPVEMILANAAIHRQYSKLENDRKLGQPSGSWLSYQEIGKKGYSLENPSVFLVEHVFCDTVLNAIKGGKLFAIVMMLSMTGWFAVQLDMMRLSLQDFLQTFAIDIAPFWINAILGTLIVVPLISGIKGVSWLANASMPILVITLAYALYSTERRTESPPDINISYWEAVSLIIAVEIAAIADLPTFFQHARSRRDAIISIVVLFGCVVPLIEGIGLYLSYHVNGGSILDIFKAGHGYLWSLWIALFLLLAGWTTNNTNLYSAVVNAGSLFPRWNFSTKILLIGGLGTLLAYFDPLQHLEIGLNIIGIGIGSMGAVIFSCYLKERYLNKYTQPSWGLAAWITGSAVGLCSHLQYIKFTEIPTLDAFLMASCLTFVLNKRGNNEPAYT